jgi:hypothetical protein
MPTEPTDSALSAAVELAGSIPFQVRVQAAAIKAAVSVAAEDSGTANHDRRLQLAGQVLRSPEAWGRVLAQGVASNASILANAMTDTEIPDSDIEYTVNSLWDAYAGQANT